MHFETCLWYKGKMFKWLKTYTASLAIKGLMMILQDLHHTQCRAPMSIVGIIFSYLYRVNGWVVYKVCLNDMHYWVEYVHVCYYNQAETAQ